MSDIHLLHSAAGQSTMKRFVCPCCKETLLTSEPINVLMLCTLCDLVLVEEKLV